MRNRDALASWVVKLCSAARFCRRKLNSTQMTLCTAWSDNKINVNLFAIACLRLCRNDLHFNGAHLYAVGAVGLRGIGPVQGSSAGGDALYIEIRAVEPMERSNELRQGSSAGPANYFSAVWNGRVQS